MRLRAAVVAFLVMVGALTVSACSSSTEALPVPAGAVIVDVRTPAEFADGHLAGALNLDVQDPQFAARLSSLDKGGSYLVYCRSGNRSAAAVQQMKSMGFTDVTDLGSKEAASAATGVEVVR